jgi:hypothetical protein
MQSVALLPVCTVTSPNKGMEPTAYSVRFASASGSGSCLALGGSWGKRTIQPTVKGAYDCWQHAC